MWNRNFKLGWQIAIVLTIVILIALIVMLLFGTLETDVKAWASGWGSFAGGAFGGVATIIAFYFTVKHYNLQLQYLKERNAELDRRNKDLDDRYKKQFVPALDLKFVSEEKMQFYINKGYLVIERTIFINRGRTLLGSSADNHKIFHIVVKNKGNDIARNIKYSHYYHDNNGDEISRSNLELFDVLQTNDGIILRLEIYSKEEEWKQVHISLNYLNIYDIEYKTRDIVIRHYDQDKWSGYIV